MKRILSIAFAFAVAGTMLSGCDRDQASRPAGAGGTTSTAPSGGASGSASGSASGTTTPDPQKKSPSAPGGASGGASGSASGTTGSK